MAGKNRANNSVFIDKTREILTANPIQAAIADLGGNSSNKRQSRQYISGLKKCKNNIK